MWVCIVLIANTPLICCRFPYVGPDLGLASPSARHEPNTARLRIRAMYHAMCLFTPQLSPSTHFAYSQRDGSG